MGGNQSTGHRVGGGKGATATGGSGSVARQQSNEEQRRLRAEAMERKLAGKRNRTKGKATKSQQQWEKYKALDKAVKQKKTGSGATVENGILKQSGDPDARPKGKSRKERADIGPQSAIFSTR